MLGVGMCLVLSQSESVLDCFTMCSLDSNLLVLVQVSVFGAKKGNYV